MGKLFLSDVLKNLSPAGVTSDFFDKFRTTPNDVMDMVYNRPFPNRYLGSVALFLSDYMQVDYVNQLVTDNFKRFFVRNVRQYDYQNYPIRFIGSLASRYVDTLTEVAREFGAHLDMVEESPMMGLIEFHSLALDDA